MATHNADYLIIGNSAAGVTAAEMLRALQPEASILMLSREPHHCYGRPLISYLLEGKTDLDHIHYKDLDFYEKNSIQTLFGAEYEAVKLDPQGHAATLANGDTCTYGKCLLATGSNPFVPPITGLEGRSNTHTFITLDDALEALEDVQAAAAAAHAEGRDCNVIVIGGGLIGMKAAEALSHHCDRIDVFDRSPRILPAVLDVTGAGIVSRLLEPYGIYTHSQMSADELLGDGDRVTHVRLTDGSEIPCDVVIIAVGVRPASGIAVDAGAEQGRGLIVGEDLQTSLPDIYAAGDVTQVTDTLDGAKRPLALWPNAIRQARIAAANMAGLPNAPKEEGSFAVNAVDFFEISLLTSGIINPPEDGDFDVRIVAEGDSYAKFVLRDNKLVGYVLLNRPDDAGIYTALITAGIDASLLADDVFSRAPQNMDFPEPARTMRIHKGYPRSLDEYGWKREAEGRL